MATVQTGKLNRLQQLPEGALVDAAWLERQGYSSSLRSQYVSSGWLNQPAPRVYRRGAGQVYWQQVVISAQHFLDLPLTVGGRTALEQLGYGHYLGDRREVHLYGPARPPGWFASLPIDAAFHWHNSLRLFEEAAVPAPAHAEPRPDGFLPGGFLAAGPAMQWPMNLSSPERAMLELLDELPARESFHQVDMLMEGLSNLSPRRLQPLLETCKSVKVKRLFFFFADRHRHAWLTKLDKASVDLGSGKRLLVKGGKLDRDYGITVPKDLDGL